LPIEQLIVSLQPFEEHRTSQKACTGLFQTEARLVHVSENAKTNQQVTVVFGIARVTIGVTVGQALRGRLASLVVASAVGGFVQDVEVAERRGIGTHVCSFALGAALVELFLVVRAGALVVVEHAVVGADEWGN
jgi:hypothetical protein|tara:strand:+ start:76 stop:477 length:402 start_codon:yes stop_codon:yes gene_type:complete